MKYVQKSLMVSLFLSFQGIQTESQAMADALNRQNDYLPNFRGSEKYLYLQSEINALFQKLENINGVSAGYLDR